MKKAVKFLSFVLCVVTMFTIFAIVPSAISSSSTAQEMLTYYENCLKTTSKKDVIQAVESLKMSSKADLSKLTAADKADVLEINDIWAEDGYFWDQTSTVYFHGDSKKEYYIEKKSEIVYTFSIQRRMADFNTKLKSGKLTTASNGDITLTLTVVPKSGSTSDTGTYTIKIASSGLIKSFTYKKVEKYTDTSPAGVKFNVTDTLIDAYTFSYKKVAVKSIGFEQEEITINYGDVVDLKVLYNPEGATFCDYYIKEDAEFNGFTATYKDSQTVTIEGTDKGSDTLVIYSSDGDIQGTCKVTVKMNFLQMIIKFFRDLFASILGY